MDFFDRTLVAVIDAIPGALIWLDREQKPLLFNQEATRMFGYSAAEASELALCDLLLPQSCIDLSRHIDAQWSPAASSVQAAPTQAVLCRRKSGELFVAEASIRDAVVQDTPATVLLLLETAGESKAGEAGPSGAAAGIEPRRPCRVDDFLKKSNEQLALAIEGSGVGLWDWQVRTGELDINERWADIVGYKLEELAPVTIETWSRLCHPDDLSKANKALSMHFTGQAPAYEQELRMLHKKGYWVWVLDRGRVTEWDEAGNPVRVTGTHLDITERHRMEEMLVYRLDFENLLNRISTHFINLETSEIDKEITHSLGEIGEFEQVDRSYIFLIDHLQNKMNNTHEWCREGIEPQIEMLKGLSLDIFPWWMKNLEGNEPIVVSHVENLPAEASAEKEILQAQDILSVTVVPIYVNNQLLGFAGFDSVKTAKEWGQDSVALLQQYGNILGNLLERKRVESALRRSEERNSAILRAIPDNMFRINSEGVILDFIASDPGSLILPAEQIRGTGVSQVLGEDLAPVVLEKIQSALQTGQKQAIEYQLSPQSQPEHFEARIVASGENEVIAIVRNVSERARLEQLKSDFINRATHELRTPITTILLMVRLLESECTQEERVEYWNVLKEELDRERNLIEDLLTVERLERDRWVVKLQPVDPCESLRQSIQTVSPQALQKDVSIVLADSCEEIRVMGDSSSLNQIFTNLLSNAVKFTPPNGRIVIRCSQELDKACFEITDTGIGIPTEELPHMFNRFFRGRNAIDNEIPGSGIGLFIVKSMVENFGGEVSLDSRVGMGTSVSFWLPIAQEWEPE